MAVQKSHRSKSKKTLRNNLSVLKKNYSKNIRVLVFKKTVFKSLSKFI